MEEKINNLKAKNFYQDDIPDSSLNNTEIKKGAIEDNKSSEKGNRNFALQFSANLVTRCLYCEGEDIIRRGWRQNKHENIQLYQCNACGRAFSGKKMKGKHYPARLVIDGVSFHNIGFTYEESCNFLERHYGVKVSPDTLSRWVYELRDLCTYGRMREYGLRLYSPNEIIQSIKLFHRQIYHFRYHRAKMSLLLQDYKHSRFYLLREFLDTVTTECPHQLFKESKRASELKPRFPLDEVRISEKTNFATRMADFVLQAVTDKKLQHETLQRFMLANDSVSVATEVPVLLYREDIDHMRENLGFNLQIEFDRVITGHIDIVQVRNGCVHILDFKPDAKRKNAVDQLTIYALALSRLTGLRLFDFRCAWFDNRSFYEFFPLHVVLKKKTRKRKSARKEEAITDKEGIHVLG